MRVEEIEEKIIYGISRRTKNSNEMNPKTAKIGTVWQKFDSTVEVNYKDGERVYGVFHATTLHVVACIQQSNAMAA